VITEVVGEGRERIGGRGEKGPARMSRKKNDLQGHRKPDQGRRDICNQQRDTNVSFTTRRTQKKGKGGKGRDIHKRERQDLRTG